MHSSYHNTLMLCKDGMLHTFATAVYQPNKNRSDELLINGSKLDFVLNNGYAE